MSSGEESYSKQCASIRALLQKIRTILFDDYMYPSTQNTKGVIAYVRQINYKPEFLCLIDYLDYKMDAGHNRVISKGICDIDAPGYLHLRKLMLMVFPERPIHELGIRYDGDRAKRSVELQGVLIRYTREKKQLPGVVKILGGVLAEIQRWKPVSSFENENGDDA